MPSRLVPPVLSLDAGKMHQIDPSNACSLMAMWSMFSKCSDTLKDGHRLENMSWRVWSRESLCVTPVDSSPARSSGVPSLSNSYSSDDSDSLSVKDSSTINSRSRSFGQDDCSSSLSRSRHLTSHTLEKIVVTIQEKVALCPLSPSIAASLPALQNANPTKSLPDQEAHDIDATAALQDSTESCLSALTATTTSTPHQSEHRNSDTSVSSDGLIRTGSIVHGFSPIASSFRSRASSAVGPPEQGSKSIAKRKTLKPAMFTLGGSSEDDESSFEQRLLTLRPPPQKSSLSQSLSKGNLASNPNSAPPSKRTSFRDVVAERRIQEDAENDEGAIESSDDEDDTDDVAESAIEEDDEDEGEWEDSNSDDGKAGGLGEAVFRRVESRPDLVSRRSMLTLALNNKGPTNLNHAYSQPALLRTRGSSPPRDGSMAESPEDDDAMMMQTSRRPPIAIPPPKVNGKSVAHSPRTTRRNMLSTELTESLRKNLLWERQQKSQAANAFLKRSRNAQSMANLQAHTVPTIGPTQPPPAAADTSRNNSWNHYFDNPWEYHAKGW